MKRSYHSDLIVQYKLGMLNEKILKQIPSSTLHNWKNRDIHHLFGLESVHDFEKNKELIKTFVESQKMQKVARSMYEVYKTYNQILEKVSEKSKILRESREEIVRTIENVRPALGFKRSLKAFGITYQQFYAWKKHVRCKMSDKFLCRKLNPKQLTQKEIDIISKYLKSPIYQHWNLSSIYYQILRDKAAFFSKTSYYKYVRKLNIERRAKFKKPVKEGIRADGPRKILHMDVTQFRAMDNTRIYIYFLVDNYSRYILNWKASYEYSATMSYENVSEAYDRYDLRKMPPYIDIITDGGPENKGKFEAYVNHTKDNLKKLVAQTDIKFSNSMVEAVNKTIKYDYLFTRDLYSLEDIKRFLEFAVADYNNKPHSALHGLTPHEVFDGMIPLKDMFTNQIRLAGRKRRKANLDQDCLDCF